MRSKLVWALVALNAVLLTALLGQWVRPNEAVAQFAPQARPSDYLIVPGTVQGSPSEVLYIVDTQNGLLSARLFDGQQFSDMAPIALNRIFGQQGNQGRGRR